LPSTKIVGAVRSPNMPSQDSGIKRSFECAESRQAAEIRLNGQAMVSLPCPELSVGRKHSRNDGRVEDLDTTASTLRSQNAIITRG
jgi:hypothetical protein